MSNSKISQDTALIAADLAPTNDLIPIVDISESSPSSRNKSMTAAALSRVGKILYVDSVYGSDSTGTRGSFFAPFATPTAAQAAASSGDTIEVRPGSYALSAVLGKAGVNWRLQSGVTLTGGFGLSVFDVTTAMTFTVDMAGATLTAAGAPTVNVNHASADVTLEGGTITCSGASYAALHNAAGTLTARHALINSNATNAAVRHATAATKTKLDWCEVRNTGVANGAVNAELAGFIMQGGVLVNAGTNSLYAGSAVNVTLYGTVMANVAKHANVTLLCGTLEVDTDVT